MKIEFIMDVLYPICIIFLIVFSLRLIAYFECKLAYEAGYLQACKDSNQGTLKYHLKENPDGSKTWTKIP